jgi:hypothetical protein
MIKSLVILILCNFIWLLGSSNTRQVYSQADEAKKAKELWEKAITAKGGRERLYSICNVVISSKMKYQKLSSQVTDGNHIESLYVLPNKWWQWVDDRPGDFGLFISTYDFDSQIGWEISDKFPNVKSFKLSSTLDSGGSSKSKSDYARFLVRKEQFVERQIIYLMETKWLQPTVVTSRTENLNFKTYDVIATTLDNLSRKVRVDFYLDQKTHLPEQLVFRTWIESVGRDYVEVWTLGDYIDVKGIKLPKKASIGSNEKNETTYQINVAYDKSIFERPPTLDMGSEAWKLSP